jgi:hypothetical protein
MYSLEGAALPMGELLHGIQASEKVIQSSRMIVHFAVKPKGCRQTPWLPRLETDDQSRTSHECCSNSNTVYRHTLRLLKCPKPDLTGDNQSAEVPISGESGSTRRIQTKARAPKRDRKPHALPKARKTTTERTAKVTTIPVVAVSSITSLSRDRSISRTACPNVHDFNHVEANLT